MNDKYYAICELDKDCNINHVFVDTISSNYGDVKSTWHNVNFRFAPNSFIALCEANNHHKKNMVIINMVLKK